MNGNLTLIMAAFAATLRDRGTVSPAVERALMALPTLGFIAMVEFIGELNPGTHWVDRVVQMFYLGTPLV